LSFYFHIDWGLLADDRHPNQYGNKMTIDPFKITDFERSEAELEEFILFAISVAGKNAATTAKALDRFLSVLYESVSASTPIEALREALKGISWRNLAYLAKLSGLGCYTQRARSFEALVEHSALYDLRTSDIKALSQKKIKGIGPKTARFFVVHSRKDSDFAILDTHVLKYLRDQGVKRVPKATPSEGKDYQRLEKAFLGFVRDSGKSVADFDLAIWTKYAKKP
jgi:thermostable 8-oxoguanine DNA glycosylase